MTATVYRMHSVDGHGCTAKSVAEVRAGATRRASESCCSPRAGGVTGNAADEVRAKSTRTLRFGLWHSGRDWAGQSGGGAEGGQNIEGSWNQCGRQAAERQGHQKHQRILNLRPPRPPGNRRHGENVLQIDPMIQGGPIDDQHHAAQQPRQMAQWK